ELKQFEISKGGKKDLAQQYDMFYTYGAQSLNSKFYDEEISLFAPIWLKKQLPKYFVIYKVPGSVTISNLTNIPSGSINAGIEYKLIGSESFQISYNNTIYSVGETFLGISGFINYTILNSESGDKVIINNEN